MKKNWRSLAEYEVWEERYIEILEQLSEDPLNPDLQAEFTKMSAEYDEWMILIAEMEEAMEEFDLDSSD